MPVTLAMTNAWVSLASAAHARRILIYAAQGIVLCKN